MSNIGRISEPNREERIAVLVRRISETEAELQDLIAGQVDAVLDARTAAPLLLRKAQAALRASEERYRILANAVPEQVWTAEPEGDLDYVNQRMLDYTGRDFKELIGPGLPGVIHPEDRPRALECWRESLDTGRNYEVEVRLKRRDGVYRWHIGRAVPQRDSDGSVLKWFGYNTDIEDQREIGRLERARREAEMANQVKSEFMAVMSHELRTPLNAILGYVDLLLTGVPEPLPDKSTQSVEHVQASARHLLELIEEILSFSRLEAGRERIRLATVDLGEIVRDTGELVEPLALERGLEFRVRTPAEPVEMEADPGKIRQILMNLLSNAIKFTEQGEVDLTAETTGTEIALSVRDTGTGIPADKLDSIFEPFEQVDASWTRRAGGTGLGLNVARGLARLLGGEIAVESEPGEGSTFTVRLPRGNRE